MFVTPDAFGVPQPQPVTVKDGPRDAVAKVMRHFDRDIRDARREMKAWSADPMQDSLSVWNHLVMITEVLDELLEQLRPIVDGDGDARYERWCRDRGYAE